MIAFIGGICAENDVVVLVSISGVLLGLLVGGIMYEQGKQDLVKELGLTLQKGEE
jgi:hypothetical protein